jgi:hypothetical protein
MHTLIKQIPKRPRLCPVCEFTTANHRDGNMKYSNPFSILLNVLENIWQHQYDVTYESIQKSRLYILDGSSYLLKVDGSRSAQDFASANTKE